MPAMPSGGKISHPPATLGLRPGLPAAMTRNPSGSRAFGTRKYNDAVSARIEGTGRAQISPLAIVP